MIRTIVVAAPLKADSLIILDVFPKDARSGYYGDLTRTVVRGKANEAQRALWWTVFDAQKLALQKIVAGGSGVSLQKEVTEFFLQQGYPTEIRDGRWVGFFHGLGHGFGLEIHEQPRIAKTKFKTGQILTVEPGLYYPGVGGVRIEDDGVVTEKGFKVLSKFGKGWRSSGSGQCQLPVVSKRRKSEKLSVQLPVVSDNMN